MKYSIDRFLLLSKLPLTMNIRKLTMNDVMNLPLENFLKLLEGEDVNKIVMEGDEMQGEILLFLLIDFKRLDVLKRIENIDVNIRNGFRETPLLASWYNYDISKLLIERGANVNDRTCNGNTIFHHCATENNLELISLFLTGEADINIKNNSGITPLRNACYFNNMEIIKFLLENGAKVEYNEEGIPECLIFDGGFDSPSQEKIEEMKEIIRKYETMNKKGVKRG